MNVVNYFDLYSDIKPSLHSLYKPRLNIIIKICYLFWLANILFTILLPLGS